jgi:hypothetical protein
MGSGGGVVESELVKGGANGGQEEEGLLAPPPTVKAVHYAEEPPAHGWHDAVLVDWCYLDLNYQKLRLAFQLAQRKARNGRRMWVSRDFSSTFSKGSNLRKWVETWLGRPFDERTAQESGWDPETFIDLPCRLLVHPVPWLPDRPFVRLEDVMPWDWSLRRNPLQPEEVIRTRHHLAPWLRAPGTGSTAPSQDHPIRRSRSKRTAQ